MRLKLTYKFYILIKISIWTIYCGYALNVFFNIDKIELVVGFLLCGILLQLTLMSFIRSWYKYGTPKLIEWFYLSTFISLIINFLLLIPYLDSHCFLLVNNVVTVSSDQVLLSLFIILVGVIGLKIPNSFFSYKSNNNVKKIELVRFNYKILFYSFSIFIVFLQFYLIYEGIIGYGKGEENAVAMYSFLLQIVDIMSPLFLITYSVFLFVYHKNSRVLKILFLFYFFSQLFIGLLSGMKEEFITSLIVVLIPYLIGGNKISKKIIVLGGVFLFLLYPINNNYRKILNENTVLPKNIAIQLAFVKTFTTGIGDSFTSGAESYQGRISLFPIFMYSIQEEKKWSEYKNLNRYLYLPLAWILPRFILPSKPVSDTGAIFNEMLTGSRLSSITPSTYGWSYFEGGVFQVFLSFFLLGIVIRILEVKLGKESFLGLLIYVSVLVSLLKVEADVYFRISGIFQTILICVIYFKIFVKK